MKLKLILSACLAVATLAPVAATAQSHERVVRERTVVRHSVRHNERGPGWRNHNRRVCKMEWRNHRKVRICRTTRW